MAGPDRDPDADRPVLVIFGAALRPDGSPSPVLLARIEAALRLARRLERPLFLPTGGRGIRGPTEAESMATALMQAGIDRADILPEPTARDTLDSAVAVRAMLAGHRGQVWAVTSGFHLPRCWLLLRLAGLRAHAAPPPPAPAARRWWWRLREIPALPWDATLMLWIRLRRG